MSELDGDCLDLKRVVWVVFTQFYEWSYGDPEDGYRLSEIEVEGVFTSRDKSDAKIKELEEKYRAEGMSEDEFGVGRRKLTLN